MAAATNSQMQKYADDRIRRRAEQLRALRSSCADDKMAIGDCYERAVSANQWADSRDDPPHLLQAGDTASPNDFTNYNLLITLIDKFFSGTFATVEEANSASAAWTTLQAACVNQLL